ncbi:MAG: prolyl oligopeptidase family serine peptidase [Bacteroidota bacterium]|nr:prolyl oligopeptidase family serine peptidase [Bacteroidota bacterium]
MKEMKQEVDDMDHRFDILEKQLQDLLWYQKVGDVAVIDKVYITGPPATNIKNPTAMGIDNPLKFYTYVFIPRGIDLSKKYPLMVLPHGGVHGDLTTYYTHIIRELMYQGYIVAAPEYRGSTGYGKSFYEHIDYGGLENGDVNAARDWMLENYDFVDKSRVGIMGWSHGGMIALMNIFDWPEDYKVAFAGVPVSDLIARMGYQTQSYRDLYSADYHIGKTAHDNVEEYKRRSPAWNAHKLQTPLLIHTNTNDDDVNVLEVQHLIKSLKAEEKDFEYEIYKDVEGGHSFDRIDTQIAQEIRVKIYKFLAQYLNPPEKIDNTKELKKAAYRIR